MSVASVTPAPEVTLHKGVVDVAARLLGLKFKAKRQKDGPLYTANEANAPWTPNTKLGVTFMGKDPMPFLRAVPKASVVNLFTEDPAQATAVKSAFPSATVHLGGPEGALAVKAGDRSGLTVIQVDPNPSLFHLPGNERISLRGARWGFGGDCTAIPDYLVYLDLAMQSSTVVLLVIPTALVDTELRAVEGQWHELVAARTIRLDLAPGVVSEAGTSLVVLTPGTHFRKFHVTDLASVSDAIDAVWEVVGDLPTCSWMNQDPAQLLLIHHEEQTYKAKPTMPVTKAIRKLAADAPTVRLALGGRCQRIVVVPNGESPAERLTAKLAFAEARLRIGYLSSEGFKPQSRVAWTCDLPRMAGRSLEAMERMKQDLEACGLRVTVDDQLRRHLRKADRRAHGENIPLPQWVLAKDGSSWTLQNSETESLPFAKEGLAYLQARDSVFAPRCWAVPTGLTIKQWDRTTKSHVPVEWPKVKAYPFAQMDASRALARRSVVYSAKQGLGKTRFSIVAFLASGMSRGLWVLESRLIDEFKRELKRLGMLDEFNLISTRDDIRNLKRINVVAYNKLWKPVSGSTKRREAEDRFGAGGTFAQALAKYRLMVFFDEAHKIKSPDSKQAVAARYLAQRAKRVIMLTGTAIQSYARNILGLLSAGWGDGTAQNPYGAGIRRPIAGGYEHYDHTKKRSKLRGALVAGGTRFRDDFVELVAYTPGTVDSELATSRKTKVREMPRIKDQGRWRSFLAPKLLRRVPGEPEVRASGFTLPEAKPEWVPVAPSADHFAYYHQVLTNFAHVWEKRLKDEAMGIKRPSNNCVLPELDALRFASTVPIIPGKLVAVSPVMAYPSNQPTALMLEAASRICRWVEEGERVIVGAEKPAALQWLSTILANPEKWLGDFEPVESILALDTDIDRRNKAINIARDNSEVPVLMITVGMGKEGLNLPEFGKLLTLDLGWIPGDLDQFRHRILRPGQTSSAIEIVHLYHQGMIDSYMHQLTTAKADAINEAVDGKASAFDYESWKDYRTFCLEMLSNEGYKFATDALAATASMGGALSIAKIA